MADRAATQTIPAIWADGAINVPLTPSSGVTYRKTTISNADITNAWRYATVVDSSIHNEIGNRLTSLMQLVEQYGVMPWGALTTYPVGAKAMGSDFVVYHSLEAANIGNDPISNPTKWLSEASDVYDPRRFGSVVNGSGDDSAGITAAVAEMPGTGGILELAGGLWKFNSSILINKPNIKVKIAHDALLDLSEVAGAGTSNVHGTTDVIAGFKVSTANVNISGGRVTGVGSFGGNNVLGVLLTAGADDFCIEGTKFDSLYTSLWPGGGISNYKMLNVGIDGCSHNLKIGYDNQVTNDPQVTGGDIIGIESKNSTNDGIKLNSWATKISIIGGSYHDNAKDGLDLFVSGEFINVNGVKSYNNTVKGIDIKYGFPILDGGLNRNCVVNGSQFLSNGDDGVSVAGANHDDNPDLPEGLVLTDNFSWGNTLIGFNIQLRASTISNNIATRNGSHGFQLESIPDNSFIGNVADQNCQTHVSDISGFHFQLRAGSAPPKTMRLVAMGNVAVGSGAANKQQIGFQLTDATMENSKWIGNSSYNHNTANWSIPAGMTDMTFRDNIGYVTENSGLSGAIATGATIAHGLAAAPAFVSVNAAESGPTDITVSADATNITVNFGGGGSKTFYWQAKTEYAK